MRERKKMEEREKRWFEGRVFSSRVLHFTSALGRNPLHKRTVWTRSTSRFSNRYLSL